MSRRSLPGFLLSLPGAEYAGILLRIPAWIEFATPEIPPLSGCDLWSH